MKSNLLYILSNFIIMFTFHYYLMIVYVYKYIYILIKYIKLTLIKYKL